MLTVFGITYTFTSNYGSCFQAYALQKVVNGMTVSNDKCRHYIIPISASPGYPKTYGNEIKQHVKSFINHFSRQNFVGFEQQYIEFAPVKPIDRFAEYNKDADAFVCGSDVIWNPKYNHGVSAYYLDFARKYAFSYAASFGQGDVKPDDLSIIGSFISNLDAISVREKHSLDIANKCTDKRIDIVIDPVLLLSSDLWNQIAEKDNQNGRYIFVYSVNTTPLLKSFVNKLSKQTDLKVIYSAGNAGAVFKQGFKKQYSPERWLQLIRDAEYVVTDSFHGTAFSVLFQKDFFTIENGNPDEGFNIRMTDFLCGLELDDRIITSMPLIIETANIDYKEANEILEEKISFSKNYLKENLEIAYQMKMKALN